ncbi:ABC transporter substrate-binding protein [Paenibacillus sp. UNC451MF]|uniref:ABC transporter substrate-binding protein n=1 Tax=Paenibacillus sp. UNC451MF TaxID=1449063 RepID=UPI00048E0523|nr:extracellular solute-binding protein [Paenibacillus sp. UNC451MF]
MNTKKLKVAAACITVIGLLSACGSASGGAKDVGSSSKAGNTSSASTPKSLVDEKVDLVIYCEGGTSADNFNTTYGNALKTKFPNWTITYIPRSTNDSLDKMITSGSQIDIVLDSIGYFPDGVLKAALQSDMTELIKKYNVDMNRFEPSLIDGIKLFSKKGEIYGLPVANTGLVLYYNKDIFDKFGVTYPKDGMTWNEAIDLGKKLTRQENGTQYLGLAASQGHIMKLNPFSLPSVDPETNKSTINSPKYSSKWQAIYQTVYKATTEAPGYADFIKSNKDKVPFSDEFGKSKNVAMFGFLSGQYWTDMNWDEVSIPTFKDLPGIGAQSYPTYAAITSISKHREEAMQLLQYLVSDEFQMQLSKTGGMTSLKSEDIKKVIGQQSPYPGKNYAAAYYNKFAPISQKSKYDTTAESGYRKHITDYIYGTMDLNTLFRTAQEDADKALERAIAK